MNVEPLTNEMIATIHTRIVQRQERYPEEDLLMSLGVVLCWYGDERTVAHCVRGDWSGPKGEMGRTPSGLPACPRCGGVATQEAQRWKLALVEDLPL